MDDRPSSPAEGGASLAETLSASADSGPGPVPAPAGGEPAFPVRDWDRYECLGFLGQGGMGKVFRGRDRRLGREVALKFVRLEDDRHLARFLAEARAQARVDHPNVCKVFEVGEVEGRVFIAMQFVGGLPFDAAARDLSLEEKVVALRDAALGVHEAHRMGIIHRDLKPSNLLVERLADGSLRTFVMDFGLAKEWNQDLTETGAVLGTPAYMSPEQARGEVSGLDRRTDVYGLGATLYQVVTGRPPIPGSHPLEILSAIGTTEVAPMRGPGLDAPRDLEAIALKCLEKERARRYDSARALADDLDRFLAGDPVLARPAGAWYRLRRRISRHRQLAAVVGAAAVLVLLALGAAVKARRDAGRREALARQFTEAMARIESLARYSALSPAHDIRPDLEAVRALMTQLQADMDRAGSLARGPGHYALGRAWWALDDGERAREHLQMAWDAGYREPRVAYALSLALGREYRDRLLEAERLASPDQRAARLKEVERGLRDPALAYLRKAGGADAPSPAYLEALLAFYEGRLDEALERLRALGQDLPWFYEAPLLRGSLLQARAWRRWNQGDRDGALADFEAGRGVLRAAAEAGRSVPAVHAARGELELNALIMEKYGQGQVLPPFTRGLDAVRTALAIQPDHAPSLILQAALLGDLADVRATRGEGAEEPARQAVEAAWKAVAAGPLRADARVALGKAYYQWGSVRLDRSLDPTEQLTRGLQAFEGLSAEKRDYTVWNHLGLLQQAWADFEAERGRDPSAHLDGAIRAYGAATRMESHLLPAWINLGTCLHQRAGLPRALDPDGDLEASARALEQARVLNPKHFVPYFVLGKVRLAQALRIRDRGGDPRADLQQSLDLNRQGGTINPAIPHLHNGAGLALMELARTTWEEGGDPRPLLAQAGAAFARAVAIAPGQPFGYQNQGELLIWAGRHLGRPSDLPAAGAALRRGLAAAPGHPGLRMTLGRFEAAQAERALQAGADPSPSLRAGAALLEGALAQEPDHRDAWQYLGELRAAGARWKALRGRAAPADFETAREAFRQAEIRNPGALETVLALGQLHLARAEWARRAGADPRGPLDEGLAATARLLQARPRWAEARRLQADLHLEAARGLPPGERQAGLEAAARERTEAAALNPNVRAAPPAASAGDADGAGPDRAAGARRL